MFSLQDSVSRQVLLVVVMGLGKLCKRIDEEYMLDLVMNMEIIMVLIGLYRIMLLDPGFLTHHSCADLSILNSVDKIESQGKVLRELCYGIRPSLSSFWKLYRSMKSCSFYSACC
ncbi:protein S-acyltransferase [Salvia divinorum]|uniref:Protein S-acyltransferase n=1 Tax=Salvia divinorum TaxID=28513 RepID=A0ABD1GJB2_SALDI